MVKSPKSPRKKSPKKLLKLDGGMFISAKAKHHNKFKKSPQATSINQDIKVLQKAQSAAKGALNKVLSQASPKSVNGELKVLAKGELAAEKAAYKVISPLSLKNLLALALLYPHLSSSPQHQRMEDQRVSELNDKWQRQFGDKQSLSLYEKHAGDDSMRAFEKLHKDPNFAWVSYDHFLKDWQEIKNSKSGNQYKNLASAFFAPKPLKEISKKVKRNKEKLLPYY